MKKTIYLLLCVTLMSCNSSQSQNIEKEFNAMPTKIKQIELTNSTVKEYTFLDCMYDDSYFPTFLVDKCKTICQISPRGIIYYNLVLSQIFTYQKCFPIKEYSQFHMCATQNHSLVGCTGLRRPVDQ